ncbi:MAG: hypothetical protein QUS09_00260, partial [Methanotrichaceae archaeon]|nr:hypothetical protein [Methanotrichaceae archaeon]
VGPLHLFMCILLMDLVDSVDKEDQVDGENPLYLTLHDTHSTAFRCAQRSTINAGMEGRVNTPLFDALARAVALAASTVNHPGIRGSCRIVVNRLELP